MTMDKEKLYEEYMNKEKKRIQTNLEYAANGVSFIDIKQVYITGNVKIGSGTVIYPNVIIEGNVEIGNDCLIGQNTKIIDSKIGNKTEVESSVITKSLVGERTKIGPFAYLRPESNIGSDCKIGDFVEVKNSKMGDGSKASHLSYIGDSQVGKNVNIGCGVVFVNYDGSNKHGSTINDGAFIGCNVNLVSPVTVEENAYIAAGSTVTNDVASGALYVARNKGKTVKGWVERRGLLKEKK